MIYYRFRPASELALKELLYDELFLASPSDCNDPYDGMAFLAFGPEGDKWRRLIDFAWDKLEFPRKSTAVSSLVERVVACCPLSYADAVAYDFEGAINGLSSVVAESLANALALRLRGMLELYRPQPPYFASFSETSQNPIMWSHYASMHHGHCMIFRDLDGHLEQCPRRRKRTIQRSTTRGMAPNMSFAVPDKFRFHKVSYQESAEIRDAFACMPAAVYGRKLSEQERRQLIESQQRDNLTKHIGWAYEDEVRITLSRGTSWLFGAHLECTPLERLLYFRPTQLVGLIVGARMPAQQRLRLREVCKARLDRIAIDIGKHGVDDPFFDFIIFEAGLLNDRRDLTIEPAEIFTLGSSYSPSDNKFAERLQRWQEGWALVFREKGTRKQQFK